MAYQQLLGALLPGWGREKTETPRAAGDTLPPRPGDLAIDDVVWVRLTDRGREILEQQDKALFGTHLPPVEDSAGWSPWPLHELMERFGDFVGSGQEPPFERVIRIRGEL